MPSQQENGDIGTAEPEAIVDVGVAVLDAGGAHLRFAYLRRVSGTWHHEIPRADGALVAADRARGAFLDLEGRVRPSPAGLRRELLAGEPAL